MFKEYVVDIGKSPRQGKKYRATVYDIKTKKTRHVDFGDLRYQQYRDSTPRRVRRYADLDHGDLRRRRAYFLRHSGVATKMHALELEMRRSKGRLTSKVLSHRFLW